MYFPSFLPDIYMVFVMNNAFGGAMLLAHGGGGRRAEDDDVASKRRACASLRRLSEQRQPMVTGAVAWIWETESSM